MPTTFQKAERRVKTSNGWSDPISYATSSESVEMTNGTDLQTKMNAVDQTISSHTSNTSNPHNVTKSQVGLGNVDNTSDANKPISTATQTALDGKLSTNLKGANSGLAELDANGKVPSSQLPSYVDDVLEYSSKSSFPTTGETGKIYVDTSTNLTYRWSGSAYVEISPSLALGETSSTAYRGDRGKTAYDHSQSTHARTDATKTEASSTNGNIKINGTETTVYTHPGSGTNPHGTTKTDVGLGNVGNFKAVSTVASQGLTTTEQSNARANIGAGTSSLTIGTTSTTALAGDTKYAGASTAGGAATSAAKLTNTSKIGDTNKPVYFTANGVPTAISYTIEKSVPSDAVFTDTTYSLVGANGTTGLIKNGSTVTSSSGYTACPIISGVPYYKDTNTTTGTSYNAGSCPDNTTFATNGSVARAYSALNSKIPTSETEYKVTDGLVIKKFGKIINVECNGAIVSNILAQTLPASYRPVRQLWIPAFMITGGNDYCAGLSINTDGTFTAIWYPPGSPHINMDSAYNSHILFLNTTYIVD